MADRILTANRPDGSRLFACVSPGARFTEPEVSDHRLSAVLHPFPDEASARVALVAAGGKLEGEAT